MRRHVSGRRGYASLSSVLLTFLIVMWLLPVLTLCAGSAQKLLSFDTELQDEAALGQLRRIFLLAYETEVYPDRVEFTYQKRQMRLSEVNGNLILQPGTQIFLTDIDCASFHTEGGLVYVRYSRKDRDYDRVLAKLPERIRERAVSGSLSFSVRPGDDSG